MKHVTFSVSNRSSGATAIAEHRPLITLTLALLPVGTGLMTLSVGMLVDDGRWRRRLRELLCQSDA